MTKIAATMANSQMLSLKKFSHLSCSLIVIILFYGLEYLQSHLRNPGIAVCLYGFLSPFSFRNGKVVHIEGKPIISSAYSGLN